MRNIWIIFKKEFASYFNSPIAYISIIAFILLTMFFVFFMQAFFVVKQAAMSGFFRILPFLLVPFAPAITMRLWAEEKKSGTIEILMTFPVRDIEVILGKFLAAFAFLSLMILLTFTLVVTVSVLGSPDPGPIIGGYVGAILLGAAYLAIGTWISSLTENQIVAFLVTLVLIAFLVFTGWSSVLTMMPGFLSELVRFVSLSTHFEYISMGCIRLSDVVYYLSTIFFFLFLTMLSVQSRKWK
jgi:ABC-2 type transport system permease protein